METISWKEFKDMVEARGVKDSDKMFFISWMSPYALHVGRGIAGITITDRAEDLSTDETGTERHYDHARD